MEDPTTEHVLFGVPHSLYTGVARCYLRTQGIPYRELPTLHPRFAQEIVPAIGRSIVPVLVTPDGQIVQDSVDIIDHFEAGGVPYPAYPEGPLQRVLAILVQYYGSQGLRRHAMHYRWSFLDDQETFLRDAFAAGAGADLADRIMARMHSYLPPLGVTEATIPAIEESFSTLLAILDAHFAEHPYLFGGQPSVADYGMIGPLFAHLGRDPVPAGIMKRRAPRVFRWVERMTAPGLDVPEFADYGAGFASDDAVPPTLEPLFAHMAEELFPELTDKLAFLDAHVAEVNPHDGQPVADKPHRRQVGQVETAFRGYPVTLGVEPYMLYMLRQADRVVAGLGEAEQRRVREALEHYGLDEALPGGRGYSVDRRNHVEVWEV